MELVIYRLLTTPTHTMGRLYVINTHIDHLGFQSYSPDTYICDTLEPPLPNAIPTGTFSLLLTLSPRFRRPLPLLVDVPHRSGIRIHRGNTPADTSGCILPGLYDAPAHLSQSTDAEVRIVSLLRQHPAPHTIQILNAFQNSITTSHL